MKYIVLLILCLGISNKSFADCSSNGIWAYATDDELNQNSIIIVEAYAFSRAIIDSLNISYFVYLESDEERVELETLEICKGMFYISQALFSLDGPLKNGQPYDLKIVNRQNKEQNILKKWNSAKKQHEPYSWLAGPSQIRPKPKLNESIELVAKSVHWYGCGPAIYADFDLGIKDSSLTLVRTELFDIEKDESHVYFLAVAYDGVVRVGHGMCSGAFDFRDKAKYKIRFSTIGSNEKNDIEWTDWTLFDSPYEAPEWNRENYQISQEWKNGDEE